MHALMGDTTAEQAMKAIINSEDMSNMWKTNSYADKRKCDNNITPISIPESWLHINTTITPGLWSTWKAPGSLCSNIVTH
eukprot:9443898-Ditylum_brightwellii.AAC.1